MSTLSGHKVLLHVSDDDGSTWSLTACKVTSHNNASSEVDVSDKLSNGLRELADGAGITTHDFSISGAWKDSTADGLLAAASGADGSLLVKLEEGTGTPLVVFQGTCKVIDYNTESPHDNVKTYTCSLKSSGDVTYLGVSRTVTAVS